MAEDSALTVLTESKKSLYPSEDEEEEEEILSHKVTMERFQDGLTEMILVCDLVPLSRSYE